MKLSEAIVLGDTLRTRNSMGYLSNAEDGSCLGCALGGAILAVGGTVKQWQRSHFGSPGAFLRQWWPWFTEEHESAITRMFFKVCGLDGAEPMKFEELVDRVRAMEPACGECNRFTCTCSTLKETTVGYPVEALI